MTTPQQPGDQPAKLVPWPSTGHVAVPGGVAAVPGPDSYGADHSRPCLPGCTCPHAPQHDSTPQPAPCPDCHSSSCAGECGGNGAPGVRNEAQRRIADLVEARERAELARLTRKYGPVDVDDPPTAQHRVHHAAGHPTDWRANVASAKAADAAYLAEEARRDAELRTDAEDVEPPADAPTVLHEAIDEVDRLGDEHHEDTDPLNLVIDGFRRWATARADELTVRQPCPYGCVGGHTEYEYGDTHRNPEGGH